ncbi:sensor histidine kinase [Actinomyces sp. oral taxon 171]|uniref:sensor histidine kinase n=2 Tax=Actinomyces sp. oral taxon 171 TaxID=706438 RepID=UPI0010FBF7A7|nr:HAMP domain-containing sensor histidine kinase [Actinomyces sp. oral taxon 171]QCT32307.1 HAMP domain-containing histidine kinase [Actinomyces sp. oral taxon 171 str. F0337]
MSLRSWGPGSLLTPPRSLRTRLVVGVLGLVLVMAAVMSSFSTVSLRHTLMARTDSQLMAAAQRAADKRHDLTQEARKASDEAVQEGTEKPGGQPDGAGGADGDPGKQGVPPGLDAAGQSTGTLTLITAQTSASSSEAAAYIDKDGHYAAISKEDCRLLLSKATEDHPVTVHLHHLGTYRVVATRDEASGSTVITGLSLEGDKGLIRTQLLIELAVALVGALVVALAGRTMVRSALAPLERVARTAHRVASQPLERGEVSIEDRVEKADLDSSAEVGQVGGALNTLLGHVESALTARQRSETQVRQFVADASHELRTPLASIRGYTELIRREGADADLPEEATYALERVHSESVRMTALVEDLLLLARLDAGRELRREEVDLVGLLVDTVADARAAGPDHDWRLDLAVLEPPADATADEAEDFLPEPPLVIGDEARLRQVIVNLLANARVHTPAGSHVTATLARERDTLIVRIHDDGPGIAPDVRDRLFERFARGDSSRERRTGSTGLGMSIALAIVQSHGGSIDVDSSTAPEDHGTTFTVRLPAAAVEE